MLQSAITAVPAVKYALGVAGIAAAAAIATAFFRTPASALAGTLVVFVMMVLLLLFATATQAARGFLLIPALFLTWSLVLLFVGSLAFTASSVFFRFPVPYDELIQQFSPTKRVQIVVVAVEKASGNPVAGAAVVLKGVTVSRKGTTRANGKASFDGIRVTEPRLVATVSAAGFEDGHGEIDPSDLQATYTVPLNLLAVSPPPRKQPGPRKSDQGGSMPAGISAAGRLTGTWQLVIVGDIRNARIRQGTFQFLPQDDGEILVTANFHLDDVEVSVSGVSSTVGSQVFLKFNAKTDASGSWSGRADFRLETPTQMNGRLEARNGDSVPVSLKKISK